MDAQVGESSACATALLCGVKANYETVGLDSSARFEDCYSSFEARVPSLINWAQDQVDTLPEPAGATPAICMRAYALLTRALPALYVHAGMKGRACFGAIIKMNGPAD
ncbi:PREDICTED: alkaline phosphatase-like [Trachymyrmex cornetzi]|uniref:alkaline phosphatase n=1 Tax=Acromyrmex echinatior TaxID=103372 RepID=F4WZ89_ACREC|nr:PREDICTED: alkaline phosphatase-like [Trachymyrmex cornetzi]EGI60478.1 Intestinal alkaline phosphatase 1 [Acromyrmex echinatior]